MKLLLTIIKGRDLTGKIMEILLLVLILIFHNEYSSISNRRGESNRRRCSHRPVLNRRGVFMSTSFQ